MKLRRNKNQPRRSESSTAHRYKQIRSYKDRINTLCSALQELVDEMGDLQKKEHYQAIIDAKVKLFRPFKKTSEFRGVSWHGPSEKWRSRIHRPDGDGEDIDYHDTELEAALAYDAKVKEYHPDKPHFKNFLDPGERQEQVKARRKIGVPQKRRFIGRHLSVREIRAINPMGIGYFNEKQCDLALKYIEKQQGTTIGRRD